MVIQKEHKEFYTVDLNQGWETPPGYPKASSSKYWQAPWMKKTSAAFARAICASLPAFTRPRLLCTIIGKKFILSRGDLIVGNDANGDGGVSFPSNTYACRPPGTFHGPFKTEHGCLLLEVSHLRRTGGAFGVKTLIPIEHTLQELAAGELRSSVLVNACVQAIEDATGEGRRTFTRTFSDSARATAWQFDLHRAAGPLAGLPVSVKDLFDVAGERTTAGSVVLADATLASADSVAVARLRAAGAILMGKTNMTEFAFSGLGINPHYGTPCNPYDRPSQRIPGGSSSGAAISVADGMAHAALASDTGGSVRIPAALCGLTGFKTDRQAGSA